MLAPIFVFLQKISIAFIPSVFDLPFSTLNFKAIKNVPPQFFWFFVIFLSLFALYFFYECYKNFIAARKMQDTPTAKIRSAPQGYVELEGIQRCLPEQPIHGFLSKLPCTWYRYAISRYHKKRWVLLEHGASNELFLLDDGTGICLIDPNKAEIITPLKDCWYGFVPHPKGKPKNILSKISSALWGNYRYQEWRMEEGMPLYALGNFKTASEFNHLFTQSSRFKDEVETLAKQWKKNKKKILAEFDQDQDGKLSSDEWEKVLEKAQKMLEKKWFNFANVDINILSADGLKAPYILAARQQAKMIRKLKFSALAWLIAYICVLVLILWLLSIYFN